MKQTPIPDWVELLDKQIRLSLVTAWELGKRQKDTPYKYNLDTDKLGQPIFNIIHKTLASQRRETIEEIRKEVSIRGEFIGITNDKMITLKKLWEYLDALYD